MPEHPPIIDMRNRPTCLHPFFGATPGTPDYETVRWLNRRVGSRDVDHFTRSTDLDGYLAETADADTMFAPGGRLYFEAANGFMADQFLFGTSYPFRAMRQSVDDLRGAGLASDVLEKVSWRTASRLFGLSMG